jgi:hypothetical protein
MVRSFAAILVGLSIGAIVGLFMRHRSKRRRAGELARHPERLDEMLDPTDDA